MGNKVKLKIMNSDRKITISAGILFIVGMLAGILSVAPSVDSSDYLIKASENANQVILGAIFQFIMSIAYLGIPIILISILRKYNEKLALGFLIFRIIATVFIIIGVVNLLLLLALSQEFVKAGAPDQSYFHVLGTMLKTARDLINHVVMIISLSIGGFMFYLLLYKTKLVPRWLSVWGLIGTILTIIASLLVMFNLIDIITTLYITLNVPMALLELILAVWLIAKGFNTSVLNSIKNKEINNKPTKSL
jgi:Domain of unknown function (DUF4386)